MVHEEVTNLVTYNFVWKTNRRKIKHYVATIRNQNKSFIAIELVIITIIHTIVQISQQGMIYNYQK
jgi:hypothetical protein